VRIVHLSVEKQMNRSRNLSTNFTIATLEPSGIPEKNIDSPMACTYRQSQNSPTEFVPHQVRKAVAQPSYKPEMILNLFENNEIQVVSPRSAQPSITAQNRGLQRPKTGAGLIWRRSGRIR
jgi:hypothetical protein